MTTLPTEILPIDSGRWTQAVQFAKQLCDDGTVPAIALCVGSSRGVIPPVMCGRQNVRQTASLREDAIFLIASITKPIVGTAALMLVERGLLSLGDRVCDIIPEFGGTGRYAVTVRHLLTHTSGLPDMLPNNVELRAGNSPLSAFVAGTCQASPAFPPGRGVQYQSMGFAMLGEIIARVTGSACRDFLRKEVFLPLGMTDTELGAPNAWFEGPNPVTDRIAEIRLPKEHDPSSSWHWNGRYWRSLGAPWGGLLTTPSDLARFSQMMLNHGERDGVRILSPAGVRAATRNQLKPMRGISVEDRRCKPWGLGWRLNWPVHSANFGDLLGPRTYGHWGATGTLLWIDPDLDAFAIILTTQPQEPHGRYIARLSNLIAASFR